MGNTGALNNAFYALTHTDYNNNIYAYARDNDVANRPISVNLKISFLNPIGTALTLANANHLMIFKITTKY